MKTLAQLEKHQIGLRLPKYLVDELDELTREYAVNRSEIIVESIKSFISAQKEQMFYEGFDKSCNKLKEVLEGGDVTSLKTLDEIIDEIRD